MRKLGELRVVAKEHHALQLVIELTNDRKQGLGLGGYSRSSTTISLAL